MKPSTLSVCLCLALVSPAMAQTGAASSRKTAAKPEETAKAGDAPARPRPQFSLFGDSSRFNKMGGWGGVGGTMAQFGLTKAMLVNMPGVQKELKLTEKQKEEIKEWSETFRKKGEDLAKKAGVGPGGPPPGEGAGGPGGGAPNAQNVAGQIFKAMNFFSTLNDFFKEAEDAADKILTRQQKTRLNQIALQMEGLQALGKPEVARAMNLDPQQYEAIQQILTNAKTGQMTYWVGQMTQMAMANGFRRPGGGRPGAPGQAREPGQADGQGQAQPVGRFGGAGRPRGAEPAKAERERPRDEEPADPAQAEKQRLEREKAREAMRERFQKIQQGSDGIQNNATTQILKILTKGQKARFEKMLGEPFDPNNLAPREAVTPAEAEAAAKAADAKRAADRAATAAKKADAPRPPSLRERRLGKAAASPE